MKPRKQCKKCPWRVSTNPREIPGGYCEKKHAALSKTIAEPGAINLGGALRVMVAVDRALTGIEMAPGFKARSQGVPAEWIKDGHRVVYAATAIPPLAVRAQGLPLYRGRQHLLIL